VLGWAARTAGVRYVEPDFVITPTLSSNDPSLGQLWGLHNIGQSGGVVDADIDAPEAWNTTTGSRNVVVAVIDTGMDYKHPDLAPNTWRNPGEVAGDGIDNDGNGFIDDIHGWDFANNDSSPMDDNGHGTHVSGTIGAVGNNGSGVVGVNWQVSIMPLKFLTGSGSGSTSAAVAAINYATRMRRDFGINVVATNNSWGGGGLSPAFCSWPLRETRPITTIPRHRIPAVTRAPR
jgi:subtilisin family serine protease